jgi:hypothetical protein
MIALLWPLGLVALAALALPVLIHLLRRPQDRVVPFAAWQYVAEQVSFRERLQLRAQVLLALRLLLLATLALLIAAPVWRHVAPAGARWVLVAPDVDPAAAHAAVESGREWHWLQPGFPSLSVVPAPVSDLALLRELDARLPIATPLTVIVPAQLEDHDAVRLRLRRAVDWRIVAGELPPARAAVPTVALRAAAGRAREQQTVVALVDAWRAAGHALDLDVGAPGSPLPPGTQLLFWFGDDPDAPALRWLADGGTLVQSQSQSQSQSGAWPPRPRAEGRGRRFTLDGAFDVQAIPALAEADQPERLRALLLRPIPPPARTLASAVAPQDGAPTTIEPGHALQPWLIALAALLFAGERLCAAWQSGRRDDG